MPLLVEQRHGAGEGTQPVSQEPFCSGLSSRTLPILSARDRRALAASRPLRINKRRVPTSA